MSEGMSFRQRGRVDTTATGGGMDARACGAQGGRVCVCVCVLCVCGWTVEWRIDYVGRARRSGRNRTGGRYELKNSMLFQSIMQGASE